MKPLNARIISLVGLAASQWLVGCATLEPEIRRPDARIVQLKIASLPPGACIFLNGEFMGMTPLTIPVEATPEGKWKHDVFIQCQVPQDTSTEDTYTSYKGFAVPKHLLFRIGRYMFWWSATQQHKPNLP